MNTLGAGLFSVVEKLYISRAYIGLGSGRAMTIGVVTRQGAWICPGGPEHLPGLFTRTLSGPYPDFR